MTGKVLIIGEKGRDGKVLGDAIRKDSAFLCRIMSRADASLAAILKFGPDIVVLNPDDAVGPMSDYVQVLRKQEPLAETPFILLVSEDELRNANISNGVQDVFCKPLRTGECVARVLMLYKKFNRIAGDKNVIRAGTLEVDVTKYEVRVGDRKIDLTYTEYELLKFLMTHPDHVFSRDVLLNKVWGYEYYGGARTVDVHIRRLRSKIEYKSVRFIDTVRNIGYKFISQEKD